MPSRPLGSNGEERGTERQVARGLYLKRWANAAGVESPADSPFKVKWSVNGR